MNKSDQPATTISQALAEFLDDQKARISPKTFSKYRSIIELYKIYLDALEPRLKPRIAGQICAPIHSSSLRPIRSRCLFAIAARALGSASSQ